MPIVYKSNARALMYKRKPSKMKELLTALAFLLSGVAAEGPYPPSGWRPNGPAFDLPSSTQRPLKQNYLPPLDPRNTGAGPTALPGEDVSVQGLPTQEEQQIFQVSPINGQQYVGPSFNADIQNLDQRFRQAQFQAQQERARQLARQRQIEAQDFESRRQSTQQTPRQFVQRTTTSDQNDFRTTTEAINLNEGETLNDNQKAIPAKQSTSAVQVEVTKQDIQEYPAEVYLSPLAQLQYQPQVISFNQLSQLKAPIFFQPAQNDASQRQTSEGYDGPTHFAALTSILTQRQFAAQPQDERQQFAQVTIIPEEPVAQYQPVNNQYQPVQVQQVYPQYQAQPVALQPQATYQQPGQVGSVNVPSNVDQTYAFQQSYQPQLYQTPVQPQANQPSQVENFGQNLGVSQQPQFYQVQSQPQPQQPSQVENIDQNQAVQPQFYQFVTTQPKTSQQPSQVEQFGQNPIYQQPQFIQIQPQTQAQKPNSDQVENIGQSQLAYQQPQYYQLQNQFDQRNYGQPQPNQAYALYYQQQILGQQVQSPQNALQSGLDVNQQGNDISENKDDKGNTATAVATAFGARTQPRVPTRYGPPQANPGAEATTDSDREEVTESSAAARATDVANAERKKNAKLRARRVRPVFTLDRSGHLILAQEQ